MFEVPKRVGRPPLNPRIASSMPSCEYSKAEGVGAIYPAVIGTVFIKRAVKTPNVLINDRMQLLNVILTHVHDSEPALALLSGIELGGKKILADKAYSSEQIRFFIAEHGAFACIPEKSISKQSMISTPAFISNAILLSGSFSELKITVTLPRATTNWLFALRI